MKASQTFNTVFKQARSFHYDAFVCFYLSCASREVGFVASKKVGKAVERNFARRRMRELFRADKAKLPRGRYVLVAKKPIGEQPYSVLREQFARAVNQITRTN